MPFHHPFRRLMPSVLFLIGLAVPQPLAGQQGAGPASPPVTLTLAEAYALAARQNPEVLAERERVAAAAGSLRQASAWRSNPDIAFLGSSNPSLTLTQDIEWAGQRGQRRASAGARLDAVRYGRVDAARMLMIEVGEAFDLGIAAAARRRIADEAARLTSNLLDAVRIQLREGEISPLDANLGEIELGRARARAAAARREQEQAEGRLRRLLGLAPSTSLTLVDAAPAPDSLSPTDRVQRAMRLRPDLQAREAEITAARADLAVARRDALPALRLGFGVERDAGFGPAVGVSLPLFNRNGGTIAAREADVRRAEQLRRGMEASVRQEVATALDALGAASEAYQFFEKNVLEPARTNTRLLEESYRAGKIPLSTLLLLRNQLLEAELESWDAWQAWRDAIVALDAATGLTLPLLDSSEGASTAPANKDNS